jgi:hypothetical protein
LTDNSAKKPLMAIKEKNAFPLSAENEPLKELYAYNVK